eukprot:CAMPEP_0178956684 /NCGR_PEP_ID=MMETSP0789-20121207/10430_1 /TAXON_ID=3005 /ORGANISM="Rhizosolenia setigera, Strain CCMP 1694" /LENGTH=457 /DNA_ID=CAMNT_0020638719 /DNA_START=138 /DNA_END=1511 /DNA_ORIENTATION=+
MAILSPPQNASSASLAATEIANNATASIRSRNTAISSLAVHEIEKQKENTSLSSTGRNIEEISKSTISSLVNNGNNASHGKTSNSADSDKNMHLVNAVAGAWSGAFAKTVVAPIERLKLLLQLRGSMVAGVVTSNSVDKNTTTAKQQPNTGRVSAFRLAVDVYKNQGLIAFWRGNTPNVIRQGGTSAINFMLMDSYKTAITPLLNYTLSFPSERTLEERKRRRLLLSSFLSGGLAGGTTTTVLYPVEFLRTRLAMDMGNSPETRKYPKGMRDVFRSTFQIDGFKGFYQGYGIAVFGVIVYRALHLGGYDALKKEIVFQQQNIYDTSSTRSKLLCTIFGISSSPIQSATSHHISISQSSSLPDSSLTFSQRFMAAQIVSIVAGTICYPIDSVRRRLMMQAGLPSLVEKKYKNSFDCFAKVMRAEGIRGFYLGIGPNIVRSFGSALLLVGYDAFRGMIM